MPTVMVTGFTAVRPFESVQVISKVYVPVTVEIPLKVPAENESQLIRFRPTLAVYAVGVNLSGDVDLIRLLGDLLLAH